MIDKNFLESLSPVEIQMIHQYIGILFKEKISEETDNYDNLEHTIKECPHCHSKHFVRNGRSTKTNRQRYICKDCSRSFEDTTNTFFFHSRLKYNTWMTFIGCEIVGLTLLEETAICGISKTSCFNMRHRLYKALSDYEESRKLKGQCEIDCAYTSINLKGFKKKDMPRLSKKRGKHKPYSTYKDLRGISHHKICLLSAIDEEDHILFKIAGLGVEDIKKYDKYSNYFSKKTAFICDEKRCIESFCNKHHFTCDIIPSGAFVSPKGNSLSSINQLHQEFSDLLRKKHGVSVRHLQGYMDFLVVNKELRYTLELKRMNTRIYMDILRKPLPFTTRDISHFPLPIDLSIAYREYNYRYTDDIDISKNNIEDMRLNQPIS